MKSEYQEALDRIKSQRVKVNSWEYRAFADKNSDLDTLQELVDRATPMKPLYKIPEHKRRKDGEELSHCPVCEWQLNCKYGCQNNKCRQCIDWSDE